MIIYLKQHLLVSEQAVLLRQQQPDHRTSGKTGNMLAKGSLASEKAADCVYGKKNQQGDRHTRKKDGAVFDREDHEHGDQTVDARRRAFPLVELIYESHEQPRAECGYKIAEQRFHRAKLRFNGIPDDQHRRCVNQDMKRPNVKKGGGDQSPNFPLSDLLIRQMQGAVQISLVVSGKQLFLSRNCNVFWDQKEGIKNINRDDRRAEGNCKNRHTAETSFPGDAVFTSSNLN